MATRLIMHNLFKNILQSELSMGTMIYSQHKLHSGWLVSATKSPLLIYIQLNSDQLYFTNKVQNIRFMLSIHKNENLFLNVTLN